MKASVVDLRYHMNDVLKALARNEEVIVMYHGEEKGVIIPVKSKKATVKVQDTPLFGMYKDTKEDVGTTMKKLRQGRYRDL